MLPVLEVTVKLTPLLGTLATVTMTLPGVAPEGTGATILVSLQLVGVAAVPLKVSVLVACEPPKPEPETVTDVPTGPVVGLTLMMLGGGVTVKSTPLLATPPTNTTTLPVVAPCGTGTVMLVLLQLDDLDCVPLNWTKLEIVPTVGPKFVPVMVTMPPMGPDVGLMLVMLGGGVTVKSTLLLATPPTVTTTFPVVAPAGTVTVMLVALHEEAVATVLLKVTVLFPCGVPKFEPVMIIFAPTGPCERLRLEMTGAEAARFVSEKFAGVATPETDAVML
jgi:hypothetical protein